MISVSLIRMMKITWSYHLYYPSGRGCNDCAKLLSVAGSSEHTCGTEAQWAVDCSGIRTQDLQLLHASGRRSNQLNYLLPHEMKLM